MTGPVYRLGARLDLRAAAPLAEALSTRRGGDLTLDAGDVDHIGALALQVIRAAARSWAGDGHALALANASPELADMLGLLGFSPDNLTRWEAAP